MIKTYTAARMPTALALVKRDLGPHAVILHTRTYKRGGLMGLGAHSVVEITATNAESGRPHQRWPRPVPQRDPKPAAAGELIRKTYAAAAAQMQSRQQPPPSVAPGGQGAIHTSAAPTAGQQFEAAPPQLATTQLADQMHEVKQMVARLMRQQRQRRSRAGGRVDLPQTLFNQYLQLLEQEVSEELAEEIVQHVHSVLDAQGLADAEAVRIAVLKQVARLVRADDRTRTWSRPADGRPQTVALIGPTGVGKTTTIAKLAADLKLKQHKKVALVTIDTYRIAAVDQLRTYANIIGVPLHAVLRPDELRQVLDQCQSFDVVLIDTAGRSQRDDPKLQELEKFLAAAAPHEVHLVLASTCTLAVLLDAVKRFSKVRFDRIIFTKLDEAVSFGVLLNVARKVNKRLSFLTTGQDVPHDIEPGRPERIAALVMGEGV